MAKRGPKPTPQHIKLVKGTARPGRLMDLDGERLAPPRGAEPPDWLSPDALDLWHRWAPEHEAAGHLAERDWPQLALLCDAVVQIGELSRILTPEFLREHAAGKTYPQGLAMRKHYERVFQEASAKLGFSPLDRERLPAPTQPRTTDPAERFFTE